MTTNKMHDVTLYIPARIKVTNVPAESHIEAIQYVENNFSYEIASYLTNESNLPLGDGMGIAYAEPDEDYGKYLVDEVGDTEYTNTCVYEVDRLLERDIVKCPEGRTQYDLMSSLLTAIATTFQAGERTEHVDWDVLGPQLQAAINLMGKDRIRDAEMAEAYLMDEFDPFDEDEEVFVVVRRHLRGSYRYHAVIPENLCSGVGQIFDDMHEAYAYIRRAYFEMKAFNKESEAPLIRVVFCKNALVGLAHKFSYND